MSTKATSVDSAVPQDVDLKAVASNEGLTQSEPDFKNKNKNKNNDNNNLIKTKPPRQVQNRDIHQRLSYLYQVSASTLVRHGENTTSANEILSRQYNKNMTRIAKKNVLKLSPHIKRTICKKCDRMLLPGVNGEIRLKGVGKDEKLEMKCDCGTVKRFPVGKNPDYKLFIDRSSIDIA